jgi:hypothetical protein
MKNTLREWLTLSAAADAGKNGAAPIWRGIQLLGFDDAPRMGRPDILVETLSFDIGWRLANIALHKTSLIMWDLT